MSSDSTETATDWTPPPWEPPLAGSEVEHLLGALGRLRTTLRWKAGHLDEAGLRHRIPSSSLSLGGLLLHLAMVEDFTFSTKLRGDELVEPWRSLGHDGSPDWEFTAADTMTPAGLYDVFDTAVARNDQRIASAFAEGGLDFGAHVDDGLGHHPSLRRLLCDMLEEYGRHTGHADLLREAYDGMVGEDPPDDWPPADPLAG